MQKNISAFYPILHEFFSNRFLSFVIKALTFIPGGFNFCFTKFPLLNYELNKVSLNDNAMFLR